ncbi:MAG TPA: protein kinase [Vicinamibacteria bacterium]|nr:protein kinase [Vicinamibacteria bacterium]
MTLAAGSRLGSYEIAASLGRGGMGEVYRGKDLKLGRKVAIKVLRSEFSQDAERLRRFEQEALAASALNHPNIVHIYDVHVRRGSGAAEGDAAEPDYIAMELVEGRTLREVLTEAPFLGERLYEIAIPIAAALAKAHGAGIVHRDLKPENVMVTNDGFVKILDFGLAKLLSFPFEANSEMATLAREGTRHGVLLGTVEYMSPEQAAGKNVDHRSDQFSFGLILYEMVTGRLAFRRDTAAQTLASIIESEPAPMAEANPSCPRKLETLVGRCLAKDPAGRFEDTGEIVVELKKLARDGVRAEKTTPRSATRDPMGIGSYVEREVRGVLSEVDRELREAFSSEVYQVRSSGHTRALSEARLRKALRRNRLSGAELVRREGERDWTPLYESRIFRDEVPSRGDPGDWVAKRKVLGFCQHLCVFTVFGIIWTLNTGSFPDWMGFWGVGLAAHAVGTAPSFVSLFRKKSLARVAEPKPLGSGEKKMELLSGSFREEVGRVRVLLERRGTDSELLHEVDAIVERVADLASKQKDLEEQTSEDERLRLEHLEEQARVRAEAAQTARDRKLYQRQLDVVRDRRRAIEKALGVLERLKVRQDVAEHQLRQLRLDLSRAEASSAPVPELSSRLTDIRHEVDAIEDVDEAIARELMS